MPAVNRYSPLALPGPSPADMVRGIPAIRRDPLGWLATQVERHGHRVAFPSPGRPVMLLDDVPGVRQVLQRGRGTWTKATLQYGALGRVTGAGLLTADDPPWRAHRAVLQPAFHHDGLPAVLEAAARAGRQVAAALAAGGADPVDAEQPVLGAMLDVVGRTLFDADLTGRRGADVVHAVEVALRLVAARGASPLPDRLPTPGRARLRRAVATLDAAVEGIVAQRRRRGGPPGDVLGLLLAAVDAGALPARAVRDEVLTMVIAGHETVASALTWSLHLLATHPHEQAAVHEELEAVLPGGRDPGWDDLPKLTRTRAVLDEALRLYPPAWVITRRAAADDVLPDAGAGLVVPAGTLVVLSPWLLHRRPDLYPEPEAFRPGRWLEPGREPRTATAQGGYLPFGTGARLCIGREVALVEGVGVLAALLARGGVVPAGPPPATDALVTLRPRGGLPLRWVTPAGACGPSSRPAGPPAARS